MATILTAFGVTEHIGMWTAAMGVISMATITIRAELGHRKDIKEKDTKQLEE